MRVGVLEWMRERVRGQGAGRRHRQGDVGGAASLSLRRGDRATVGFVFDGSLRRFGFAASSASSSLIFSAFTFHSSPPPIPLPTSSPLDS